MSFILSIFLCLALAFSGTGALPAEPESATTWTVRNLSFGDGTDSIALDPELRLTAAVGEEKVGLHFEVGSGKRALLPVSAEITNDEVLFAMSNGKHAYSMSAEEFALMADLDGNEEILAILSDLFTSYGALLGTVYGDEEQATAYSRAVFAAMIDACGASLETVEVEVSGQTLEAQRMELTLDIDSALKLMDGLRACGVEPMERLMDSVLALCNLEEDAEYSDFADLAAEVDEDAEFAMPMTITFAAADELAYCLVECDYSMEDGSSAQMREEFSYDGEQSDMEMTMVVSDAEPNATTAVYMISAQMQGPLNAPEAIHMNYDIVMTSATQVVYDVYEDEYADDEYVEDEHVDDEYVEDEHVEDEYAEDESAEDESVEDEYSEDEYAEDEHVEDEHVEDEYAEDDAGEDAEVGASSVVDTFVDQKVIHMTLDSAAEDGLNDVQFAVNFREFFNGEDGGSGTFHLTAAERRAADDSVTADVALNVFSEGRKFNLAFELNRAEAALEDYFDGLDVIEFTADEINAYGEEPTELLTALRHDARRMAVDALQLALDESVLQAMMKFGLSENILDMFFI